MSEFRPKGNGIALSGYRGTGKTTVGRIVADRLAVMFRDADREIESRFGSIRSIFEQHGEPAFRDREEQVIQELTEAGAGVVATGGGAILRETNRRALKRFGRVFWLTADPGELANRLERESKGVANRPSLTAAGTLGEIASVLEARMPFYQETADVAVSTQGRTPAEVADAILGILSNTGTSEASSA